MLNFVLVTHLTAVLCSCFYRSNDVDKTRVKEVYICFQEVPSDGVGSGNNCYDVDEVCINDYLIQNLCSPDRQKVIV